MVWGKPIEKERVRHGKWREAWAGGESVGLREDLWDQAGHM